MPQARINGIDIYFERHGEAGEPLVFIHGYTGDISDWRFQIEAFAPTNQVLVLDNGGHGRSEAPPDRASYTIAQMALDAEALAIEVGFERYHLVGHSMGGAIAQEIALASPGRLFSLTLEDTAYSFDLSRNEMITKLAAIRRKIAEQQGMAAVAAIPSPFPLPPHMPKEREEETQERMARMSVDGYIGAQEGLNAWPGTVDRLASIVAPTLVIYGELDFFLLIQAAKQMAKLIPGAVLESIPEAGHSPQYEPARAVQRGVETPPCARCRGIRGEIAPERRTLCRRTPDFFRRKLLTERFGARNIDVFYAKRSAHRRYRISHAVRRGAQGRRFLPDLAAARRRRNARGGTRPGDHRPGVGG
jgi:pimeloyl-ACP methyl ester carboxylesterase